MKKLAPFLSLCLLLAFSSCHKDENLSPTLGKATFSLAPKARGNGGRTNETAKPAFVLISIKANNGSVQENVKLPLFPFGQSYLTESLVTVSGTYQLTQFVVLDAAGKVIYATPLEGSDLAKYVNDPLPISFTISQDQTMQVVPQVLAVTSEDTPESFGLASFGFDVVSSSSIVLIKTRVLIAIGHIIYENVDALIRVKGYDPNNAAKWTKDYDFIGPTDILEVKNGFHHYSIELVDKWGINDIQSDISAKDIWEGRADGSASVTYVLAGSKKAKKLSMSVHSEPLDIQGTVVYPPAYRRLYTYNSDDRLEYIHYESYNAQTSQFEETHTDAFIYSGTTVSKILRSSAGKLSYEFHYEYGAQDKIKRITNGALEWTITFTNNSYNDPTDNSITAAYYYHPNGSSFLYEFDVRYKNRVSHKEFGLGEGDRICNEGTYTYDKYINPFNHLGYVDFSIEHWSANNKLSESIHYLACVFPANRVPVSYSYTYDQDGYPVKQIVTFKAPWIEDRPNPFTDKPYYSQVEFYYE